MKIDMFAHIIPQKYFSAFRQKNNDFQKGMEQRSHAALNLDIRLRLMNRYPDVLQVLTVALPHLLEEMVSPKESIELARIANDEMAELVANYPDKFVAAVASLPLNDIDASLEEIDRAITKLQIKGIQIYSTINGKALDSPEFKPIYEKMANYDLPIWIHPYQNEAMFAAGPYALVYETACAMQRLVSGGVIRDYPNIKFIAHHCGATVPLLEGRLQNKDQFRKFYGDTATYGSTAQLMCGYAFFGAEHILFATDSPMGPRFGCTLQTIQAVERMPIDDLEKEKIFLHNALDLLKVSI